MDDKSPLQIQASDSDSSQTLSYSASRLPAGLTIDSGQRPDHRDADHGGRKPRHGHGDGRDGRFGQHRLHLERRLGLVRQPVTGGAFESGNLPGWAVENASVVTDANAHSPTHDLRLNAPSGGYATMEYTVTCLSPNTTYTYAGWVRSGGATTSLAVKNYGGAQVQAHTTAASWRQESDTFTTGAGNTSATVFCYLPSGPATSSCDELSLVAG